MEEVMLQAGDARREHIKPFGRDEGEDCALGRNAILSFVSDHSYTNLKERPDLENDVIGADAI